MYYTEVSEITELLEGCEIEEVGGVTTDMIRQAVNELANSLQFEKWLRE